MQKSTVFYPPLPSQPSVRKIFLKYLSTSLHQPVFEGGDKSQKKRLLPAGHWNGEYRKRFAAIGKTLSKRVFNEKLTLN